ncbi:MAG: ATP synthase F1 subunit delta [Blastocatellia bacterium]|nr:ATP synthase F1 subunit delta [Chloracidobacterium sp.]MBL8185114.1 ATP synthase F1 subunit delta [Blastocatellia bacterium]HRJ87946.1 ATP synthase F1 subunit delta [Pyrinomonadaceae bacterium]HRK51872.1 ATP synthase F1 subunit delta [Pyrinomonadaceae bacterium]
MSVETVSRRYAAALADVVTKSGESESVRAELKGWEEMIASNNDLSTAFRNPAIAHLRKEGVLEELLKRSKPSRTTANFLRILLQNSRLTELSEINERFVSELEERVGIVHAEVSSAHELSDEHKAELKSNLEKLTGKQVKFDFEINKDLIGGVVARIGSTVYDGSVRTQLEHLREQLMQK